MKSRNEAKIKIRVYLEDTLNKERKRLMSEMAKLQKELYEYDKRTVGNTSRIWVEGRMKIVSQMQQIKAAMKKTNKSAWQSAVKWGERYTFQTQKMTRSMGEMWRKEWKKTTQRWKEEETERQRIAKENVNKAIADFKRLEAERKKMAAEGVKNAQKMAARWRTAWNENIERVIAARSNLLANQHKPILSEESIRQMDRYAGAYQRIADGATRVNKATRGAYEAMKHVNTVTQSGYKLREAFTRASGAVSTFLGKFKKSFGTLTRYFIAYQVLYGVLNMIKQGLMEILNVQRDLAKVWAITGATHQQLSQIRKDVFNISAEFGIAASSVSKFTIEMAKLGKSATEIHQLADASATLSSILGEDMAQSGRLIVTTMNQYNMATDEAWRVTSGFIDAIASSPADVTGLANTLQYVGVTAQNVGVSFEELIAMITELANKGIKMSKIGTGLRNVLLTIAKDGGDVNEALREMGENGLTVGEAAKRFQKRGANVALVLANNYEEWQKLIKTPAAEYLDGVTRKAESLANTLGRLKQIWYGVVSAFSGSGSAKAKILENVKIGKIAGDMAYLGINTSDFTGLLGGLANKNKSWGTAREQLGVFVAKNLKIRNGRSKDYISRIVEKWFSTGEISQSELNDLADAVGDYRITDRLSEIVSQINVYKAIYENQTRLSKWTDYKQKLVKELNKEVGELKKLPEEQQAKIKNVNDVMATKKSIAEQQMEATIRAIFGSTETQEQINKRIENSKKWLKKVYNGLQQAFLSDRNESFKTLLKEYRDDEKALKEVLAKLDTGTFSKSSDLSEVNRLKKEMQSLKTLLCERNPLLDICGSSGKKEAKEIIDEQYRLLVGQLKIAIQSVENKYNRDIANIGSISGLKLNGRSSALSMEEWMKGLGIIPRTFDAEYTAHAVWENYVLKFYDKLKDKASGITNQHISAVKEREMLLVSNYSSGISALEKLLSQAKTKTEQQKILDKIAALKKEREKAIGDADAEISRYELAYRKFEEAIESKKNDAERKKREADDQTEIDRKKTKFEIEKRLLQAGYEIYQQFENSILNNTLRRLSAQEDALRAHYSTERDLLRAQLKDHLITEGQYEMRRKKLEKERIDEENRINKARFEAQKKSDIASLLTKEAMAFAQILMMQLSTVPLMPAALAIAAIEKGIIAAQTAAGIAAIASRKFYPVKYATGGLIDGASHDDGGVPAIVSSRRPIELEGGEFVVNRRSTSQNYDLLKEINAQPDFTDRLVAALQNANIRAYFTDRDIDAVERYKSFVKNTVNYMP